jgi:succinate-semialdehyde dehydrogenase/glutarate-semialdehyde dehydrogenase
VKRLYLHEDVYEEFIKKLVDVTKKMKQGIPTEPNIDIGAMINEEQLKKVDEMVQIGLKEGATLLTGGRRNPNLKGYFYEPTIFANASNKMQIVQREIFGPVLVVLKFKTDEEVIKMVNDNPYGLTSSVWTQDIERGRKIAEEINTGTMMINEVVYTFALASTPWGGNKQSGIGRTHGKYGFLETTQPLHLNIDKSASTDMWWMPYDEYTQNMVENFKIISKSLIINQKNH